MKRNTLVATGLAGTFIAQIAHAGTPGSVTTAPASAATQGVPLMGATGAILLLALLGIVGIYSLRRSRLVRQSVAAVALAVTSLMAVTAVTGAFVNVVVSGGECNEVSTESFELGAEFLELISECPNEIRVIALNGCKQEGGTIAPTNNIGPCAVGTVLAGGESCTLPTCGD